MVDRNDKNPAHEATQTPLSSFPWRPRLLNPAYTTLNGSQEILRLTIDFAWAKPWLLFDPEAHETRYLREVPHKIGVEYRTLGFENPWKPWA